jgi:Ser/Thr protein kinase RdoA (MazF antagonist)
MPVTIAPVSDDPPGDHQPDHNQPDHNQPDHNTSSAATLVNLRAAVGGAVTPLASGYSGETFRAVLDGDDVVVRVYGRDPARAGVDLALLRRLRGVVPVPAVLDAVLDRQPPFVLTQWLPGERLERVLDQVSAPVGRELGRAVGTVLLSLSTVRFAHPGAFTGPDLTPRAHEVAATTLEQWVTEHLDRPGSGLARWSADDRSALLAAARGVRPLLDAVAGEATLVHGDLNPKNLLVDPDRAQVTGLLDWEYAWAGCWLADLGNLLRFPPEADDDTGQAFRAGLLELLRDGGRLRAGWLATARALDLFALVELAARAQPATGPEPVDNPVIAGATDLLLATARTGSLAAGRPDPEDPADRPGW